MTKLLLPITAIGAGLTVLIAMGVMEGGIPEIQARELASGAYRDRTVKVHGLLEKIEAGDRPLRFTVRDKDIADATFAVVADKTRPDTFSEGYDVSVEGEWDAGRNAFVADRIFTKCPSKYEDEAKEGIGSKEQYEQKKGRKYVPSAEPGK